MIFMSMCENESLDLVSVADNVLEIRNNKIDSRHF